MKANSTAAEVHAAELAKIAQQLSDLQVALAAQIPARSSDIHWGNVGDLQHTSARLAELLSHLKGEE